MGILNARSTEEDRQATLANIKNMAGPLETKLDELTSHAIVLRAKVDASITVISTSALTAVTSCNSFYPSQPILTVRPYPFQPASDMEDCARKLSMLDHTLGQVYRGAWNLYYTQQHDPKRGALWQMRHVFDCFFDCLAPDDMVRQSPHWSKKEGNKWDAVHREERLSYAAHRCIPDKEKREVLLASSTETLGIYKRLNAAHTRGELAPSTANETFQATDKIIRTWIAASNPWPPERGNISMSIIR